VVGGIPLLDRWLAGGFVGGLGLGMFGITLTPSQVTVALQTVMGIGGFVGTSLLSSLMNPQMTFSLGGTIIGTLPAIAGIVGSALMIFAARNRGGA
jgi:hypothetical protein